MHSSVIAGIRLPVPRGQQLQEMSEQRLSENGTRQQEQRRNNRVCLEDGFLPSHKQSSSMQQKLGPQHVVQRQAVREPGVWQLMQTLQFSAVVNPKAAARNKFGPILRKTCSFFFSEKYSSVQLPRNKLQRGPSIGRLGTKNA